MKKKKITKKELSKIRSAAGKKGWIASHRVRYDTLIELSKLVTRKELEWYRKEWDTVKLVHLLKRLRR